MPSFSNWTSDKLKPLLPPSDYASIRMVDTTVRDIKIVRGVTPPPMQFQSTGAMITVHHQGGLGYAATSDLTESGLKQAGLVALQRATRFANSSAVPYDQIRMPHSQGQYQTAVKNPWSKLQNSALFEILQNVAAAIPNDDRIIDWTVGIRGDHRQELLVTNRGGEVEQTIEHVIPNISVSANKGSETITRTLGSDRYTMQGGLERLDEMGFYTITPQLVEEAPGSPRRTQLSNRCHGSFART